MTIRTEMHRVPWGVEWYAIDDDLYDGADRRPLAGLGSTEAEALADLRERMEDMGLFCRCGSGPGEPHSIHCDPERRQ